MCIDSIEMWHRRARPDPNAKDFNVQLGCHFEEFAEMIEQLAWRNVMTNDEFKFAEDRTLFMYVSIFAKALKDGTIKASIKDRSEFLDSLCDQVVTAVGVGHCAGMKTSDAVTAVNSSNWSKYDVNGKPIFDANGKIAKGPNYHKPVLEGTY